MPVLIEVCVDSVAGVRVAAAAGADRVELCSALEVGGLTSSIALIEQAVQVAGSGPQVQVLIRPRPGDFHYDADEIRCMERDVAAAVAAGADGVVIGALRVDGSVDERAVGRLVAAARSDSSGGRSPVRLTFHRAFDVAADPFAALDVVRRLGFDRILTSGQAANVADGADLLAELVRRTAGDGGRSPLRILAGGGIRPANVAALIRSTGVGQVHFSGRRTVASPMHFRNPAVTMGSAGSDAYARSITDPAVVAAIIAAVRAAGERGLRAPAGESQGGVQP